jgi:hypothetical protein
MLPHWTLEQYHFAARQLGRMSRDCIKADFFQTPPGYATIMAENTWI